MQSLLLEFRKYLDDYVSHFMSPRPFLSGAHILSWGFWSRDGSSGDMHTAFFLSLLQLMTNCGARSTFEGFPPPPSLYKATWPVLWPYQRQWYYQLLYPTSQSHHMNGTCFIIWYMKLSERKGKVVSRSIVYIFLEIQHWFSHGT